MTNLWTDTYNYYVIVGYEDGPNIIGYDPLDGTPEYEQIPVYGWTGSTQLETDYAYDKAGMLQKIVKVLEEDGPTETTGHFYNRVAWASSKFRRIYDQPDGAEGAENRRLYNNKIHLRRLRNAVYNGRQQC